MRVRKRVARVRLRQLIVMLNTRVCVYLTQVLAVADGPARCATYCVLCCSVYTEVDIRVTHWSHWRRLSVDRRKYCQLSSTDDGPVDHTLSVHLCRTELTTDYDNRRAVDNVPQESRLIVGDTRASL